MQQETTLQELDLCQLEEVGGGDATSEWGLATGTAVAFTVGAATITAPLIAGAFAVGGIISAGFGIYYATSQFAD